MCPVRSVTYVSGRSQELNRYSISNIIITSIERMRDANGSRRKPAMPIAHGQISVVIDGRSIVEAYTKRRLFLTDMGLFIGQSPAFFAFMRDLAEDADEARRGR